MNRIENTSHNSYIIESRGYRSDRVENTIPVLLFTAITAVVHRGITWQRVYMLHCTIYSDESYALKAIYYSSNNYSLP
jgi:hypothetical protein